MLERCFVGTHAKTWRLWEALVNSTEFLVYSESEKWRQISEQHPEFSFGVKFMVLHDFTPVAQIDDDLIVFTLRKDHGNLKIVLLHAKTCVILFAKPGVKVGQRQLDYQTRIGVPFLSRNTAQENSTLTVSDDLGDLLVVGNILTIEGVYSKGNQPMKTFMRKPKGFLKEGQRLALEASTTMGTRSPELVPLKKEQTIVAPKRESR